MPIALWDGVMSTYAEAYKVCKCVFCGSVGLIYVVESPLNHSDQSPATKIESEPRFVF